MNRLDSLLHPDPKQSARGQILVIFVGGMFAMIAAVALVVEGSNLFAQQRVAQNGADGTANAGTVVVAENLSGVPRNGDQVAAAINGTAAANGLQAFTAEYTDDTGNPIGVAVDLANSAPADAIPAAARGVTVTASRTFDTAFARIIGMPTLTATADATVVAGKLSTQCVADQDGCTMLPVTFPITPYLCDDHGELDPNSIPWGIGAPDPDNPTGPWWKIVGEEDLPGSTAYPNGNPNEMAILSLCKTQGGAGAFGWLDLTPSVSNLAGEIQGPLNMEVNLPDWFQTQTGNPNSVEDELMAYWHTPVLIPLYDGVCREDPGGDNVCPVGQNNVDPLGNTAGNNTWYHVPTIGVFYLDQVLVQGNDVDGCTTAPGKPLQQVTTGGGFLGCIKGWFVNYLVGGPIVPGGDIIPGVTPIGIQLIK